MNEPTTPRTYKTYSIEAPVLEAAITALNAGLEHTREGLSMHDQQCGRTIAKNKRWAESMEQDIRDMENVLALLKAKV